MIDASDPGWERQLKVTDEVLAEAGQAVPAALHGLGREVALGVQAVALAHGFLQVFGAVDLSVLEAPRFGCLNIHASLLPRWRGASPIQHAIWHGDKETGVTIMLMEAGLDTGPMLAKVHTPIDAKTAGELTGELADLGAKLVVEVLAYISAHPAVPQPSEGVTYAAKIDKTESRIDFTQSALQVERQVRAFAPAPGAFFEFQGERFRILAAEVVPLSGAPGTVLDAHLTIACGDQAIRPTLIQRAGKSAMPPEIGRAHV